MESEEVWLELPLTVGEPQRVDELGANRRSSRLTQEAYFSPPARLRGLVFQNYYSASVAVHVRGRKEPGENATWHVALEVTQLMDDAHFEDDAQEWHSFDLTAPQRAAADVLDAVHAIRLTYFQPSPAWADFGVRRLGAFSRARRSSAALAGEVSHAAEPLGLAFAEPHWDGEHADLLAQMAAVLGSARRAAGLVEELAAESDCRGADEVEQRRDGTALSPLLHPSEWHGAPICAIARAPAL